MKKIFFIFTFIILLSGCSLFKPDLKQGQLIENNQNLEDCVKTCPDGREIKCSVACPEIAGGGGGMPPIFTCGTALVTATVVQTNFAANIPHHANLKISLMKINSYTPGQSIDQLINIGDNIDVSVLGQSDYSKCPLLENNNINTNRVNNVPTAVPQPVQVQICNLPAQDLYGSWNSYLLKQGDKIKLEISCKNTACSQCENWEGEDSVIKKVL